MNYSLQANSLANFSPATCSQVCLQMSVTQNSINCSCKLHFSLGAVCQSFTSETPCPMGCAKGWYPCSLQYLQILTMGRRQIQPIGRSRILSAKHTARFHHHFCRCLCMYLLVYTLHFFFFSSVRPSSFSSGDFLAV